jgi:hypothetical protein
MTGPDKRDELNRWVEIMNKTNGYGGVFNHQTAADKAIVELSTAREWRESIAVEFGVSLPTAPANRAESARRTLRVLVPAR